MTMRWLAMTAVAAGAWGWTSPAAAQCDESQQPEVIFATQSRTFSNGASWSFRPARRRCEGLVIYDAFYKPAGGAATEVLARGSIAEGHTVYLQPEGDRFLDVTEAVVGLGNILDPFNATSLVKTLTPNECAGISGTTAFLLDDNRLCVRFEDGGLGWKSRNGFRTKETLQVFMDSQVGAYNYVNLWEFHDDGRISVRLGLTGALEQVIQDPGMQPRFGQWIDNPSMAGARVGLMHVHNIYYRLDFDIGGSTDDQVQRQQFVPSTTASPDSSCGTTGQCGTINVSSITTEARQTWTPGNEDTWIIRDKVLKNTDGRNIGYELHPNVTGLWRGQSSNEEKWSGHDVFVTRWNGCELMAVRNMAPYINGCGTPAPDVFEMTGGSSGTKENVDGQDIVLWYVNRFLHYPRDEDMERMPIEWTGFELVPRNFFATNPSP
jgi:primary-amine oxidase